MKSTQLRYRFESCPDYNEIKQMTIKHNGFTYEVYIRPWKKTSKGRFEAIKYKTGFRNLWERITYQEYLEVKNK